MKSMTFPRIGSASNVNIASPELEVRLVRDAGSEFDALSLPASIALVFLSMNVEGTSHAQSDGLNQNVAFGWLYCYEPVLAPGVKSAPSK